MAVHRPSAGEGPLKVVQERVDGSSLTLYDFEPTPDTICDDVARGLSATPKTIPSKYFYDEIGARLFERITALDAYYPTRTESSILQRNAEEIAEEIGMGAALIEFGSGSGDKTWIVLRNLRSAVAYVPVDISRAQLVDFANRVVETLPGLRVVPICADYTADFILPPLPEKPRRCVAFFPGSTIGNFEPTEATAFLARVRRLVGVGGGMLLGLDLRKTPDIIEAAYNDPEGITADFNLNLLTRINRECGGDFDLSTFQHYAFFDESESRVEMRLISIVEQSVRLAPDPDEPDGLEIHFDAGEHVITEYSHKYDLESFSNVARAADWEIERFWTDEREWFAVVLLR